MRHRKDGWSAKPISERDVQRKLGGAELPPSSYLSLPSFIKIHTRMFKEMLKFLTILIGGNSNILNISFHLKS